MGLERYMGHDATARCYPFWIGQFINEVRMFKNTIGFDKICIVGTGAIGSTFGGFLSDAGYKVLQRPVLS